MPLVYSENSAPSIQEAGSSINNKIASKAQIRPIRIGLVNSMPDAAFEATERQFLRLIGSEPVLQIEPILISPTSIKHDDKIAKHIRAYYTPIDHAQRWGLDGIIFTGANIPNGPMHNFPSWWELTNLMDWAENNVVSTITSCLATHIIMKHRYHVDRILQKEKVLWLFPHEIVDDDHPLVHNMNSDIWVPHSRWNDISEEEFLKQGHKILMKNSTVGVQLAVSRDFKLVMLQGHPEYDTTSLAREYLRDKRQWNTHEPQNYMTPQLRALSPHESITNHDLKKECILKNNWVDSASIFFARWIALVYRLTNYDVHKQYMSGIDPNDPLKGI
jgi:homoserine O-succinyltransferase